MLHVLVVSTEWSCVCAPGWGAQCRLRLGFGSSTGTCCTFRLLMTSCSLMLAVLPCVY